MKYCGTCKTSRALDQFAKNRSTKDGLQLRCKPCQRVYYQANKGSIKARMRKYREENVEASRARSAQWRANNPEAAKAGQARAYRARQEYYKQRANEYYYANREAMIQASVKWDKQNRESVRAAKARYKSKRRGMLELRLYQVTGKDLRRAYNRQPFCTYCGISFADFRQATWDHVIPVTRGGDHGVGNLVPCCGSCNSSKNNKTVTEWRAKLQSLAVL